MKFIETTKTVAIAGKYISDFLSLPEGLKQALSRSQNLRLVHNFQSADVLIVFDCDRETVKALRSSTDDCGRKVLVVSEPSVVWPMGSKSRVLSLFDAVAWMGRPPEKGIEVFPWPQSLDIEPSLLLKDGRCDEEVPILNANKFSAIRGELYSLRRMSAAYLPEVSLHGVDWNLSLLGQGKKIVHSLSQALFYRQALSRTWLESAITVRTKQDMSVQNKTNFLAGYSRCLVIENSLEFVSEKLFDALSAGTYPIFVGPSIKNYGLPDWLCAQADPNLESIGMAIRQSEGVNLESWRHDVYNWLTSTDVKRQWLDVNVYSSILNWATQVRTS